jgi:hypothetical protein
MAAAGDPADVDKCRIAGRFDGRDIRFGRDHPLAALRKINPNCLIWRIFRQ